MTSLIFVSFEFLYDGIVVLVLVALAVLAGPALVQRAGSLILPCHRVSLQG